MSPNKQLSITSHCLNLSKLSLVYGLEGCVLFFFSASVLIKDRKEVVKDEAYQIQSLCLCDGDVNPDTHTHTPQKQANTQHSNYKQLQITNYTQ